MASAETAPTITASLNDGHAETASPKRPQLSWCWPKRPQPPAGPQLKWLKANRNGPIDITHHPNIKLQTNITFIYLQITSTNITLKTNRKGPFISHKNRIYMVRNNVNEYYVENKTETAPFISHKHHIYMVRHYGRQRIICWKLVLPFDTKNPYRLSKLLYRSIIDISNPWHLILAIVPVV